MAKTETGTAFTWNVPNVLTIIRLILVPVFTVIFLTHPHEQDWRYLATLVFVIAMITDAADGHIARKYGLVSNFGKIWDPIADKALTGMGFVVLSIVAELPWAFTIVILAREWGITALRFVVLKYGVMSANRGGKLKTITQSIALPLFLLWLPEFGTWFDIAKWVFMWAALVLTVITGVDYLLEARRLKAASLKAGGPVDISKLREGGEIILLSADES